MRTSNGTLRLTFGAALSLLLAACGGGGTPPDTVAPSVTLTASKTTIESGDSVSLTVSASDDRDPSVTPTLSCNAGTLSGTQLSTTRSATAATIACQASARDLAGNTSQATVNITVNPTLGKLALVAGQDKITPRKATLFEAPGIPLESASYNGSIEGTPVTLHRNIDGQTLSLLVPDGIAPGARWIDVQMGSTRQSLSLTITDLPAIANARTGAADQLQAVIAQARADLALASTNDVFTPEFRAVFQQNLATLEQTLAGLDALSAAEQRALATLLLANFAAIPRTPEAPVAGAPEPMFQKAGLSTPRLAAISPQEPQCTQAKVNLIASLSVAIPAAGVLFGLPGTPLDKAVLAVVGGIFSIDAYRSLKKYLASCIEFRDDALETEAVSRFLENAAKARPGDPQFVLSAVSPISLGFTNRQTSNFRIKRRYVYPGSTSPGAVVTALQRLMSIFSSFSLSPPEALTAARDKVANGYSEYIPASGVAIGGISRPDIGGSATGSDLRLGLRFVISDPQEESYAFTFTLTIPGGEPIPVNVAKPGTLAYMSPEQVRGGRTRVTTRSDVHALGLVLAESLTGRAVVATEGRGIAEVVEQVLSGEAPSIRAAIGGRRGSR
ncbi:MAG: hypothetical protein ACKO0U_12625, partial [Gammaproteobacteria bacterium]